MITIDNREPDEVIELILNCPAFGGYKFRIEQLEFGDFMFSFWNRKLKQWIPTATWESKTVSDLLGSMASGRLMKQITQAQSTGVEVGLLIKGDFTTWNYDPDPLNRNLIRNHNGHSKSGWSLKSIEGLKLSLMRRGIPVVQMPEPEYLPYYLRWLHDHYKGHQKDTDSFWKADSSVPIAMLDMIPSVGPKTAEKLHELFDADKQSIAGVIAQSEEELTNAVGNVMGKEVYRRLH